MTLISLFDLVRAKGQEPVAKLLGISQAAISKAINSERIIFVTAEGKDVVALEIKPFPAPVRLSDREEIIAHVMALGQHLNGSVQKYSTSVAVL